MYTKSYIVNTCDIFWDLPNLELRIVNSVFCLFCEFLMQAFFTDDKHLEIDWIGKGVSMCQFVVVDIAKIASLLPFKYLK